jgi:hypothetical protein
MLSLNAGRKEPKEYHDPIWLIMYAFEIIIQYYCPVLIRRVYVLEHSSETFANKKRSSYLLLREKYKQ